MEVIEAKHPNPEIEKPKIGFEFASASAAKIGRNPDILKNEELNEDVILSSPTAGVFAVFDGAGGHANGREAAHIAANAVNLEASNNPNVRLGELIKGATKSVAEAFQNSQEKGYAAAAIVKVLKETQTKNSSRMEVASIGDCRVYIISKEGQIRFITLDNYKETDKNNENSLKKLQGQLSEVSSRHEIIDLNLEEMFNSRNVIDQALGDTANLNPSVHQIEVFKGETILITSDGVHDNLRDSEIVRLSDTKASPKEIANNLIRAAQDRSTQTTLRSKNDDISALVLSYGANGISSSAEKDSKLLTPIELRKGQGARLNINDLPFPITLNLGGMQDIQLSLEGFDDKTRLVVTDPSNPNSRVPIKPNPENYIVFGRDQTIEEDLGMKFPQEVSREHLRFNFDGDYINIIDTSTNGTLIYKKPQA